MAIRAAPTSNKGACKLELVVAYDEFDSDVIRDLVESARGYGCIEKAKLELLSPKKIDVSNW